ncbi:AtpZ/AtpI family protein [Desertibacillus haloalkaliphilus]|uniref:AtpZ/AtpI family protein n=1 Tax=Desertibacillus haloalkaliphilus TaxID=1328930 RepID=UPI001C254F8D|nr:AtpZ/AtpI family protein [Desertibacillus haloalkaliphilus]MBU8905882.1 AtpZ/AtpI family protein [Desertibacillus haloalkaliphilus]
MSRKSQKSLVRAMALMTSIVSYLVGPILVGVFGGRWIDGYLQTEPIFLIAGLLVGLAAGVYGLARLIGEFLGEDE